MKKLEQDLEQLRLGEKKTQMLYDSCVSAVSMLEKSITDHGTHRERRLNDLNNTIKTLKADLQSASVLLKVFICALTGNSCLDISTILEFQLYFSVS